MKLLFMFALVIASEACATPHECAEMCKPNQVVSYRDGFNVECVCGTLTKQVQ